MTIQKEKNNMKNRRDKDKFEIDDDELEEN